MLRDGVLVLLIGGVVGLAGCGGSGSEGQPIDVSGFEDFEFSRAISIDTCFSSGDLGMMTMTSQAGNRSLNYTVLTTAEEGEECLVVTEEGECLVEGEVITRVLVQSENTRVDNEFRQILIANEPNDVCGTGNVTTCSDDRYIWDGLTVSADFCEPVYVSNGAEVMGLLEDLRDGPPDETENSNPLDPAFRTTPIEILNFESISMSDQVLGKNGDFVVVRTQHILDGVLLQDGTAEIDFETEIGVAVVIIRPPCKQFTGIEGSETLLTVDIRGTMEDDDDCGFDLGSIDAFLITIPKTLKKVRLFLNNSELDEIHL